MITSAFRNFTLKEEKKNCKKQILDLFHSKVHSKFRFQQEFKVRWMAVILGNREAKLWENEWKNNLELKHGEVLAKASPSSSSKWGISLWKSTSTGDTISKPFRIKDECIRAPNTGISMQSGQRDVDAKAFRNIKLAKLHVLKRLPWDYRTWRVKPNCLLNHHCQLPKCESNSSTNHSQKLHKLNCKMT